MDDLTPEEREALKNLPRERMPSAGLEDRVVGAMRERGMLTAKKPGRVVRLTTSRVAGLLAASIVLIVGAYSIGLQRGTPDQALLGVQPPELSEQMQPLSSEVDDTWRRTTTGELAEGAGDLQVEPLAKEEAAANEAPAQETTPGVKLDLPTRVGRSDGDVVIGTAPEAASGLAAQEEPATATESAREMTEVAPAKKKERRAQPPSTMAFSRDSAALQSMAPTRLRTYQLGGSAFIVDAPDSVRIVEAPDGRELLIYTSDGLIRIRLAD